MSALANFPATPGWQMRRSTPFISNTSTLRDLTSKLLFAAKVGGPGTALSERLSVGVLDSMRNLSDTLASQPVLASQRALSDSLISYRSTAGRVNPLHHHDVMAVADNSVVDQPRLVSRATDGNDEILVLLRTLVVTAQRQAAAASPKRELMMLRLTIFSAVISLGSFFGFERVLHALEALARELR